MYNLMMADGSDTFDVIGRTRIGILAALGSKTAWELQLNGSNDDAAVRYQSFLSCHQY